MCEDANQILPSLNSNFVEQITLIGKKILIVAKAVKLSELKQFLDLIKEPIKQGKYSSDIRTDRVNKFINSFWKFRFVVSLKKSLEYLPDGSFVNEFNLMIFIFRTYCDSWFIVVTVFFCACIVQSIVVN
jgi:hypothetical protein